MSDASVPCARTQAARSVGQTALGRGVLTRAHTSTMPNAFPPGCSDRSLKMIARYKLDFPDGKPGKFMSNANSGATLAVPEVVGDFDVGLLAVDTAGKVRARQAPAPLPMAVRDPQDPMRPARPTMPCAPAAAGARTRLVACRHRTCLPTCAHML